MFLPDGWKSELNGLGAVLPGGATFDLPSNSQVA